MGGKWHVVFFVLALFSGIQAFCLRTPRGVRTLAPTLQRPGRGPLFATNENDASTFEGEGARTNVLGGPLQACCFSPMTGFYRDGFCRTGVQDTGRHTVCVRVDAKFLAFSRGVGNDLSTPYPMYGFPGLNPGDSWCLCVLRWKEALAAQMAPPVVLASTHASALQVVSLQDLLMHASADSNDSEDELQ
jgi:hypothetical protein